MSQPISPHAELNAQWNSWAEGQLAERHDAEAVESSSSVGETVSADALWETWAEREVAAAASQERKTPTGSSFNQE